MSKAITEAPAQNFIAEAISEHWGDRCPDIDADCACCQAWAEYDRLSAGSAQPVSIKPLEWTFFGNTRGGAWEANGILGEYRLEPRVDSKEHWMPHVPGTVGPVSYARLSLEDAKAICQSHFDTAIRSALVPPAVPAEVEQMQDKIEGLEADLENAVEVAFKRGATEWTRLNYPDRYAILSATAPLPEIEGGDKGDGWQPIETAPKDKTHVIIAVPTKDKDDFIVGEAYFDPEHYGDDGDWWWAGTNYGDYHSGPISEVNYHGPSFWQHLPAAPSASIEGETP